MNPISTIKFIATHPFSRRRPLKGLSRYIGWQIRKLLTTKPMHFHFTPKAKMWLVKGFRGASGNYYCGLHEYADMAFVLRFLRPGDLFVDIGANVGSYTLLASGQVGANSIALEPVPKTFDWLQKNIAENRLESLVETVCIAAGVESGQIHFSSSLDAMNHALPAPMANSIMVPVVKLDDLLGARVPILIKIDVEGFESNVLAGAQSTISNTALKALVIEMGDSEIVPNVNSHQWLETLGFHPYTYDPTTRQMQVLNKRHHHNTIYVRDLDFIKERITSSVNIKIWNLPV